MARLLYYVMVLGAASAFIPNDICSQWADDISIKVITSAPRETVFFKASGMKDCGLPCRLIENATSIRANIVDTFSCADRFYGYYADQDNDCQIFHICVPMHQLFPEMYCPEDVLHFSFICPESTIFNQEAMVCDWSESAFPCYAADQLYDRNKLLFAIPQEDVQRESSVISTTPTPQRPTLCCSNRKPIASSVTVTPPVRARSSSIPASPTTTTTTITTTPIPETTQFKRGRSEAISDTYAEADSPENAASDSYNTFLSPEERGESTTLWPIDKNFTDIRTEAVTASETQPESTEYLEHSSTTPQVTVPPTEALFNAETTKQNEQESSTFMYFEIPLTTESDPLTDDPEASDSTRREFLSSIPYVATTYETGPTITVTETTTEPFWYTFAPIPREISPESKIKPPYQHLESHGSTSYHKVLRPNRADQTSPQVPREVPFYPLTIYSANGKMFYRLEG